MNIAIWARVTLSKGQNNPGAQPVVIPQAAIV